MRLILVLLFLCMPLIGCFSLQGQVVSEKSDPYAWDFGKVKEGEVLKHEFVLKNDSEKTLNIKEVHTSCGCTASEVKKKKLQPGESTIVEVKFNTKAYSGVVQQFIYVNTDSLDKPIIKFIIKADIEK